MPVVAGIDVSTQSTTVELRDADSLRLLGVGRSSHPPTHPPVSEQHPDAWWDALRAALASALAAADVRARDVDAVSVGAQCHGLVLRDARGTVLRAAKLWNDTTSATQAAAMVEGLGRDGWLRAVGSVPTAALTITKLAWMAEHEPDVLARASHVLLPHDEITHRITGDWTTDRSDASGTGYFDVRADAWRPDLLSDWVQERDWERVLPRVLGPEAVAGTPQRSAQDALGLRADVVVAPGGGDQHLAAIGLGLDVGDVAFSLGTSGVVSAISADPIVDPEGEVDGFADATGRFLPLACTLNATKVTDWTAAMLGVDVDALGVLAASCPPHRGGRPVLAAYLDGERTPDLPRATGVLAGLTTATTRAEIARAAFEGVVFGLVRAHRRLRALGCSTDGDVVLTGGGARSATYRQMLADTLATDVVTRDVAESTARGAAVQAAAVLHGIAVADAAVRWRPSSSTATYPTDRVARDVLDAYDAATAWRGADRR